ncbi:unnamed protein product [Paramecium sonneborni]|uniref:Uncharacterized protein n=1 Tax=Paramecium sonneborni TaxID=65129 RepID=A0A8S1RW60_9CILI|nr:unnamed protein product [Paramecium sonneborni]
MDKINNLVLVPSIQGKKCITRYAMTQNIKQERQLKKVGEYQKRKEKKDRQMN